MAIPIFYDKAQSVASNESFSPSAGKPERVVRAWLEDYPEDLRVHSFAPVGREDLCLAHDRKYVLDVLDVRVPNGFGNRSPQVADSLPWTTGSMLAAAQWVVSDPAARPVAVSPTSGFHHAGYDSGGGFCTFNGLMVTACALVRQGFRVGILDLDAHWGDGTEEIISVLGLNKSVVHWSFGGHIGDRVAAVRWLRRQLESLVVAHFAGVDVVLYQAGADPHIDDPLGGKLTSDELYERDLRVFRTLQWLRVPVAWNLAGGYQTPVQKVIDIHRRTMDACVQVYGGA